MTVSARLSRSLHQTLGDEAGEDLVNWMQHMDASRAELGELFELHYARFERKLETMSARLESKLENRFADLLKWSFVFWVGAVTAVAVLAGVLRR